MCLKPKIKEMNCLVRFVTLNSVIGITLAPFGIYIRKEYLNWNWIVNHEKIHWQQQIEMLIVFFYLWYLIEWFIRKFLFFQKKAYHKISFEREAFYYEENLNYLNNRKHFTWMKFLSKNNSTHYC